MTPQGIVIVAVILIVLAAAFIYDKKKADRIRKEIDGQTAGKHTADFKHGYVADNKLYLKNRVKGYIEIDLTNAATAGINRDINNKFFYWPMIYDKNGKSLMGSMFDIHEMTYDSAAEIIDAVCESCSWIEKM